MRTHLSIAGLSLALTGILSTAVLMGSMSGLPKVN